MEKHVTVAEDTLASSEPEPPLTADRGWCLCLSGGGFRATVFHLGVVLRLNELGILARLSTVTSVSGGSILNGVLATRWSRLKLAPDGTYTNLIEEVAKPVREFCSKDLRTPILLGTRLKWSNWRVLLRDWFSVAANFLAEGYEPLYHSRLSDLPASALHVPRFIFCATNVCTALAGIFTAGRRREWATFTLATVTRTMSA